MREAKPYELFSSVPGFIGPLENKRFVKKDGVFIAMKGSNYQEEVENATKAIKKSN